MYVEPSSSLFTPVFSNCLLTGCLTADQEVNGNANENVQVNADLPSGGDLIETDSYELADEHVVKLIEAISQKLELSPLPKTAQSEEFEFRLWTNLGGLGNTKLLSVRLSGSKNQVDFYDILGSLDPIQFRRETPARPRSGWNQLKFAVRSRLTTPRGLVRDPYFSLDRDEPLILLEVLDKGEYRRVFYGQDTSFQDGKRLINLCDYLASEFNVSMDCGGESASP